MLNNPPWAGSFLSNELRENPPKADETEHTHFHEHEGGRHAHTHRHVQRKRGRNDPDATSHPHSTLMTHGRHG